MNETLKLSKEEARELVWEGNIPGYEVVEDKITGKDRWSINHSVVIKTSEGRFFRTHYSVGATEYQDEQPFEYHEPIFKEVFPKEKVITIYD